MAPVMAQAPTRMPAADATALTVRERVLLFCGLNFYC
jgi:hypothetical protein